ncbi:hypothetical protein [Metabacillus arenae]|uniref:Uncharacterized protein n=1 Tax=Metabacillus arenae TaxID=2771434 RepID=A0A926NFT3_9BACI|nr:hypothetical protein [Metabacillus arenae]MBD1379208.1 hypothetical protein [Metabacillus arenae]
MATEQLKAFSEEHNHAVGNLNSLKVKTVANGAIVENADIDNFTLVQLSFNADGERVARQLSAVTNKSYLIAAPETRYMGEAMTDFYNAVGDRARIVVLEAAYTRFETSAYSLNTGVTEITNGQVAHFDPATKKFIISASGTPHVDYANASAKFLVVSNEEDIAYTFGKPMVRFEVIEA